MSTLVTIQGTDLPTNSRADINDNFSALNADKMETSVLDTDTTLAANSDEKVPTQKAVKAYVDAGGNVNASTTTKGIVELATAAEIDAGTATGATGAALVVTAEALKGSLAPIVRTYLNAGSPHTWTKPAGLKYVIVEVQGAGGNGGDATDNPAEGGGGGGGGYCKKLIGASSLGTTETVTVGAVGSSSSFGSHCSATSGANGTANNSQAVVAGGTATGGDINIGGEYSQPVDISGTSGGGGASFLGKGGAPQTSSNVNGNTGIGYGGGGSGGTATTTTDFYGGAGAPGIVIVTEYYV